MDGNGIGLLLELVQGNDVSGLPNTLTIVAVEDTESRSRVVESHRLFANSAVLAFVCCHLAFFSLIAAMRCDAASADATIPMTPAGRRGQAGAEIRATIGISDSCKKIGYGSVWPWP